MVSIGCRYRHLEKDETGMRVITFAVNGGIYSGLPIDHLFVADPGAGIHDPFCILRFGRTMVGQFGLD